MYVGLRAACMVVQPSVSHHPKDVKGFLGSPVPEDNFVLRICAMAAIFDKSEQNSKSIVF